MLNACIRCSSFFVGLISLIQALLWAAVSIWGIAIYDCTASYPFQDKPSSNDHDVVHTYLFYVSYLRGSCANTQFQWVAPSAEKSYKFMLAYSIISSIWVPTSVMLIAGTCLGARGIKAKWIYIPWILVTTACCTLDIVATISYSIDISKTLTARDYVNFLDFPNPEVKRIMGFDVTVGIDGYTASPAIVMVIIASRAVVFWVVNLFFLIFGVQGICAFYKKNPPKLPRPYHEYQEEIKRQKEIEQRREFKKPSSVDINNDPKTPQVQPSNNVQNQVDQGRINNAFLIDEPLRLSPIDIQVKQEKSNNVRYAEVENMEIEMEPTPEEIRRTSPVVDEVRGVALTSELSVPVSIAESALDAEDFEEIIKTPAPPAPQASEESLPESDPQRRVYDVYGNPTEERLTPKVARIQKIIEAQIKSSQNGYNARPFSYHQPQQPQVDTVPKKNDTIRGLEKPPIPVPDYSVRVGKSPSFRSPLPNTAAYNTIDSTSDKN